ncbi:hypothetical protein GYMLUDRAFT_252523 [Collybiopsis luxurians FD-317 M1]|uniref:Unplaced genomic scaffold GYMLUscaffold_131, whole genome shotgun sequence n=1 Tax=Collybiopsis luxurians FD-317 M1 TaxID=944289 RepID=A0A0D0B9K7_9AGAR|nr:hypothetical protein GYMLUDRAFT_252523 [Collybiopsis luxurians FD-317 M1]
MDNYQAGPDDQFPGQNAADPHTWVGSFKAHPDFSFKDASLFVKPNDTATVFGVHCNYLRKVSSTFDGMFMLPPAPGISLNEALMGKQSNDIAPAHPKKASKELSVNCDQLGHKAIEGTVIFNPIIIPVKEAWLEVLLQFLYHFGWKETFSYTVGELTDLGSICKMYDIVDGLKFAISCLNYRHEFKSVSKLYYGCQFGVPSWGARGTMDILGDHRGVDAVIGQSGYSLEPEVMNVLYNGQSNVRFYLTLLSRDIPNLNDSDTWANCHQRD